MPKSKPHRCKVCGKHDSEVRHISIRGQCNECGARKAAQAMTDIENREGPYYDKWRESIAEAMGRVAV